MHSFKTNVRIYNFEKYNTVKQIVKIQPSFNSAMYKSNFWMKLNTFYNIM